MKQPRLTGEGRGRRLARWLLALFFAVAGVGHLIAANAVVKIVPGWVPDPRLVVIATGVCELVGAAALLTPSCWADGRWRRAAGWAFAAYALCVWPANFVHAAHDLGGHVGLGWWYHGPRLLLQPLIVWWALWASGAVRGAPLRVNRH